MKYRMIFQMILVGITGILLIGCRGQTEEQKKRDTHQDSTIQIYKTIGNVSQGIESWWFKRNEEHQQPEVSTPNSSKNASFSSLSKPDNSSSICAHKATTWLF